MLQRGLKGVLRRIPTSVFNVIKPIMNKISKIDMNQLEISREILFARRLKINFEKEIKKIIINKKIMILSEGIYDYTYFNVAYLNNVMAFILYSLYKGCIPIIKINSDKPEANKWEWYFKQPLETVFAGVDVSDYKIEKCGVKNFYGPTFETVFHVGSEEFDIWNFIYRHFVVLNDEVNQYVHKEMDNMNVVGNKLGVVIRGTDYVNLKPQGHPVQPEIEELIAEIKKKFYLGKYKFIYVATEEKQLFDEIVDQFGSDIVLSNKRSYYDDLYYRKNCKYIGEVHFDRDNDNYLKGLEYLSSLIILSRCEGFVGSNCGGALAALLFSEKQEDVIVINKGYYR